MITGGSDGMGKSVAIQLAKKGANIVIVARTIAKLEAAIKEISVCNVSISSAWLARCLMLNLGLSYQSQSAIPPHKLRPHGPFFRVRNYKKSHGME